MIIVTGGAGMIGSNIIKGLNNRGYNDILVVDNLKDGNKFVNLMDLEIKDYMDKEEFLEHITSQSNFNKIEAVFHEGACSKTTMWNGKYMMKNNYLYSKLLLNFCINRAVPFLYASSAAVYGNCNKKFIEERHYEEPLNIYGYSKMLFDHYVRRILPQINSPVCGLRYFNIYGPREKHKGNMASIIFHFNTQLNNEESLKIFKGSCNFRRDFTYVKDVVEVTLWCWENDITGIYNCGTGYAKSFKEIADIIILLRQKGKIEFIPFPKKLKNHYQKFTQADLTNLRSIGYLKSFRMVNEGIKEYMQYLNVI